MKVQLADKSPAGDFPLGSYRWVTDLTKYDNYEPVKDEDGLLIKDRRYNTSLYLVKLMEDDL